MGNGKSCLLRLFFVAALILWGNLTRSFADTEIDLGDDTKAAPTTTSPQKPAPVPTAPSATQNNNPAIVSSPTPSSDIQMETQSEETPEATAESTPEVTEVHGVLKMKDIYQAGIKCYQEKDYDQAIRYLKKAIATKDPYTEKFYYAEANAMLGVIYQFHIIHYGRAYRYYHAALAYERNNPTAKRHIKQVYKYRNKKD